jgi:single-stranded-DNA-specific exonuclease
MEKQWIYKTTDEVAVEELHATLKIHRVFCRLLVQRGITTFEQARLFFRPELTHLHDPFLMKGMEAAVLRLEHAIQNQEKILLFGDYDVDGTTSVALMSAFLAPFTSHFIPYIPDRYTEGYGVSQQGIDFAATQGCSLVIAMDCGIKAVDKVAYAKTKNIDFIICDHHLPDPEVPDAVAVLDAKQADCAYPYKELSGCGVAFKLAQAYIEKNDLNFEQLLPLLDLLMVSIACDIVPITGENRVLAYFGLQRLNDNARQGLRALINAAGRSYPLSISDVVFGLGPMINAAGRLSDAKTAVKVLLCEDPTEAETQAAFLKAENLRRKTLETEMTEMAIQRFLNMPDWESRKAVVVYDAGWHKGVIGIVAARLVERFQRPSIVLTQSGEFITGSARSVSGFDINEALKNCSDFLMNFGGHRYAAGLTLPPENLAAFAKRFEQTVAATITAEQLIPTVRINADLSFEQLQHKNFWHILRQFAPFGPENMRPVFRTSRVIDAGRSKLLKEKHLKLRLRQQDTDAPPQEVIGFGMGEHYEAIKAKKTLDICYTVEMNEWHERRALQLQLKDLKIVGEQI